MMNTNLLRQKISELTKKYSSKKVSIDEDLSFSDDSGGSDRVKYRSIPGDTATIDEGNTIKLSESTNINEVESLRSPKVVAQNLESLGSAKNKEQFESINTPKSRSTSSAKDYEYLTSPKNITQRSKSVTNPSDQVDNFSDLLSDEELDNAHVIDEDSIAEDSDDSSDYHPLKNIHLVSDDFLEDILTASEATANSDNVEERLTNRSTPRSVRSIPLSPFISPPVINKKSDVKMRGFASDIDSVIEEQIDVSDRSEKYDSSFEKTESSVSASETLKKPQSTSRRSSFLSDRTLKDFESSTSASIVKSPSESSVQESISHSSNKISGRSTESKSVNRVSETASNISDNRQIDSSRSRKEGIKESREVEGIEVNTTESGNYGREVTSGDLDTIDRQKNSVAVLIDLEKSGGDFEDRNIGEDKKIGVENKKKSIKFSQSTSQKYEFSKLRKSNNKYVQCNLISDRFQRHHRSKTPIYNLVSPDREENISYLIQPRRKPLKIDTRVENLPRRPCIRTNIELFGVNSCLQSNLDFHVDCDNGIRGSVHDPTPIIAMDNILRNQIHLTKYFMDSHHKMYMACCQIVKSMNEDYQNDGLTYVKR